jgi:hypothetical protein
MKFRAFTGQIPNFVGGFSGFSPTSAGGILFNLNTYKLAGSLATTGETAPTGIWFKPDGTKLFVIGSTQDRIRSWDLTTAWDINSATNPVAMTGNLRDTGAVFIPNPNGVSFSDDGTKAFVVDGTNNALYRYSLTTAWDILSINAVADQVNTTIYTGNLTPQSIWVRPDGLFFTTWNSGASSQVRNWTSTVANDITTLTAGTFANGGNAPVGGTWADNGNVFVYVFQTTDLLFSTSYSAPYGYSGGVVRSQTTVTGYDTTPQDVYIRNDGLSFYYLGSATDTIYQFNL